MGYGGRYTASVTPPPPSSLAVAPLRYDPQLRSAGEVATRVWQRTKRVGLLTPHTYPHPHTPTHPHTHPHTPTPTPTHPHTPHPRTTRRSRPGAPRGSLDVVFVARFVCVRVLLLVWSTPKKK